MEISSFLFSFNSSWFYFVCQHCRASCSCKSSRISAKIFHFGASLVIPDICKETHTMIVELKFCSPWHFYIRWDGLCSYTCTAPRVRSKCQFFRTGKKDEAEIKYVLKAPYNPSAHQNVHGIGLHVNYHGFFKCQCHACLLIGPQITSKRSSCYNNTIRGS